ncbi:unnamed protein product [Fusarium graminearum]|nr:unnamed protein product [Fusarium graminearum]
MEQTYVYELLLLALLLCATSLVLEDHIIVPTALHVEILLVEERISKRNVSFSGILFFFESLCLLRCVLVLACAMLNDRVDIPLSSFSLLALFARDQALSRSFGATRNAGLVVFIGIVDQGRGTVLLGEMGGFSGEELGSEVAGRFVSVATLTSLTILQLGMGW